ncbi:MAG TPA: TetR-like C-terminal domain-containing protein [Candidatus Limnocylindrales bacterium]|nr:TetR-like C-terminal domain-containing protein [Candidatus Limnocylindrales bacterium]
MPTPARTSLADIVKAGRDIIESEGVDGLTMQSVATRVGVRAPSLYKRIRGRNDLLRLVANDATAALTRDLEAATTGSDPRRDLVALARAFRRFARANPGAYSLIFAPLPDDARADPEWSIKASAPVIDATQRLAGPDHALDAARTVVAWANGFIAMELAGAFRLGGDVDRAFDYGIEHIVAAIAARPKRA